MELIDFEWRRCIDGYRLVGRGSRLGLECVSEQFERIRPLETPALFAKFAKDTPTSAKGLAAFCSQFGLLGGGRSDIPRRGMPTRESVLLSELLQHHTAMRRALDLFERGSSKELIARWNATGLAMTRIELRKGPDGKLDWFLVPADLIHAMWMQFAMHASSQAQLVGCERCGKPFRVGSGTGRRNTAKYCSNACKVAAFRARKHSRNA